MTKIQGYDYCQETISLKIKLETGFLLLGERLKKIRDGFLYQPQWESFDIYLDEIKIDPATASKLITIYTKFVLEYGIAPEEIAAAGSWSNAYEISTVAKTKEDVTRWLEESKDRTPKDTKIELRKVKTGKDPDNCKHEWVSIRYCSHCNTKEKIYDKE